MKREVTSPRPAFGRAEACGAALGAPRWRPLRLARRRRTAPPGAGGGRPAGGLGSLAKGTAQGLQVSLPQEWKGNGRSVFIADGSHVSMPDTQENQAGYPQPVVQEPGIGFPLARLAVLLSLATGACHDLAIAPYAGKGTGETTLLRQMYDSLSPGDVVVADALFDNYCVIRSGGK